MAQKRGGFTAVPGRRSSVAIQDGAAYREIPGVTSFAYTAGERASTDANVLEGERSVLGAIPVTDFNFPVGGYTPLARPWTMLRDSYENDRVLTFSIITPEVKVWEKAAADPATAALAELVVGAFGSVATFARANQGPQPPDFKLDLYQRGMVLKIGANNYVIEHIDDSGAVSVLKIGADGRVLGTVADNPAVAAAAFDIVVPSLEWTFGGTVKQFGGFEGGSDEGNILSSTLVVTPSGNAASIGIPKVATRVPA